MDPTSRIVARWLGVYCLAAGLALALAPERLASRLEALLRDPALTLLGGLAALAAGAALLALCERTASAPRPRLPAVLGAVAIAKGVALIALPADVLVALYVDRLGLGRHALGWAVAIAAAGAALVGAGLRGTRR